MDEAQLLPAVGQRRLLGFDLDFRGFVTRGGQDDQRTERDE